MADGDLNTLKTIVLIDDNRTFTSLMRSVLAEFGYRDVYDFDDPEGAIDLMKTTFVDVCFLDLVMPKTSGFQVADRIRHDPELRNRMLPIIMITGHADRRNIQRAINHGIDEILVKPLRPRHLHQRLTSVLERPRVYIKTPSGYFGPDRRRRDDPNYRGPERRLEENHEVFTGAGFIHVSRLRRSVPPAPPRAIVQPAEPPAATLPPLAPPPAVQPAAERDIFMLD